VHLAYKLEKSFSVSDKGCSTVELIGYVRRRKNEELLPSCKEHTVAHRGWYAQSLEMKQLHSRPTGYRLWQTREDVSISAVSIYLLLDDILPNPLIKPHP